MPRILHLPTATAQLAEELDLVRWAIRQGFCTHDSLAASMGQARSTVSMMLAGHRPARVGLLRGLMDHLDAGQQLAVLLEQARRFGVDPGEILRQRARQEVARQAWGEVVSFAQAQLAGCPEPIVITEAALAALKAAA